MQDLPYLNLENEILKNTIITIIENIELWDNSLSYLFSDCLVKIIENSVSEIKLNDENNLNNNNITNLKSNSFNNNIINLILRFYICFIEYNDNYITIYYIRSFNAIIEILSKYRIVNVEIDLIEKATSMGSFGKKNTLRKYSLFFCTCLIRVIL